MNCCYYCRCHWNSLQHAYDRQKEELAEAMSEGEESAIYDFFSTHIATDEQMIHYGDYAGLWANWCNMNAMLKLLLEQYPQTKESSFYEMGRIFATPYPFEWEADRRIMGMIGVFVAISPQSCIQLKISLSRLQTFKEDLEEALTQAGSDMNYDDWKKQCQRKLTYLDDECWSNIEKIKPELINMLEKLEAEDGIIVAAEI